MRSCAPPLAPSSLYTHTHTLSLSLALFLSDCLDCSADGPQSGSAEPWRFNRARERVSEKKRESVLACRALTDAVAGGLTACPTPSGEQISSLSLSLTHTLTHSLARSLSLSLSRSLARSHSFSLSRSHSKGLNCWADRAEPDTG